MFQAEISDIISNYRTCEFSTLTKSNKARTHPVTAWYQAPDEYITITTSIGFPQKIYNIRRNPKVALLFSNPTGSGIASKGIVSIQGDAKLNDKLSDIDDLNIFWKRMYKWQPHSKVYHRTALSRYLFDWYYMRLCISIYPKRILYWATDDYTQSPQEIYLHDTI